eukprot:gene17539-biopygen12887
MADVIKEWHAEEVIFEAFCMNLQAFWPPKLAKSGLKDAPQRRGYTRSLPMGPINGTHGCAQKTVCPLPTRASVRAHLKVERRVLNGATQKTQGIIKNAGNHAGYCPGMACPGGRF